jgi:hypothetical protein
VDGIGDASASNLGAIVRRADWVSLWLYYGRRIANENSGSDIMVGSQWADGILQITVVAVVGDGDTASGGVTFINTRANVGLGRKPDVTNSEIVGTTRHDIVVGETGVRLAICTGTSW